VKKKKGEEEGVPNHHSFIKKGKKKKTTTDKEDGERRGRGILKTLKKGERGGRLLSTGREPLAKREKGISYGKRRGGKRGCSNLFRENSF